MNQDTQILIAKLNAMMTLIDNFPMSVLQMLNVRTYNSVFELIMDILAAVGIDVIELVQAIIKDLFGLTMEGRDALLEEIANMPDDEVSPFLSSMEDSVKSIIMNILSGIFTCSAIPIIPNKDLDSYINLNPNKRNGFSIPIQFIDYSNMLLISPMSEIGKNFYSNCTTNVTNINTLYKSYDMNAFIWYVMNRGNEFTQSEINKQMWDSRRFAAKNNFLPTSEDMDEWVNSKTISSQIEPSGKLSFSDGKDNPDIYYPILQLNNLTNEGDCIGVSFPSQRYAFNGGDKKKINDTIYKFNSDYVSSIRIFNPKVILTYMVESLFGFKLSSIGTLNIEARIIDEKIDEIINKVIEMDDIEISDCFYTFSNDDYNRMLNETIYQRYTAKKYNSEKNPSISFDINEVLSQLDEINSAATSVEKTTKITKLLNEITLTPGNEQTTEFGIGVNVNRDWWREIIRAIVTPLAKSLLTPQVMLLFAINLKELGLVDFDSLANDNSAILSFLINKIMAMIASIVKFIKDKLVELMLEFIKKKLVPYIIQYQLLIVLERYEYWVALLAEAIASCSLINVKGNKKGGIDEVNYADIVVEETTPNNDNKC